MFIRLVLFLINLVIWCLIVWPLDIQHLIVGVAIAGVVVFLIEDLFPKVAHSFINVKRIAYFLSYIILFFWYFSKGAIDMAIRVLNPCQDVEPGVIKVKSAIKSEIGIMFLAIIVNMSPGTSFIDIDNDNNVIYIHCANLKNKGVEKRVIDMIGRFESILKKVFEND